jgi:hypothetical protein
MAQPMRKANIYSRTFCEELLPGMMKPLVWSMNHPLVSGAWARFLSSLTDARGLERSELVKQIHYRAYFNMNIIAKLWEEVGMPEGSWDALFDLGGSAGSDPRSSLSPVILLRIPEVVAFLRRYFRSVAWQEEFLARREKEWRAFEEGISGLTEDELLSRVDDLGKDMERVMFYNVIVPLASAVFDQELEKRLRTAGSDHAGLSDRTFGTQLNDLDEADPSPRRSSIRTAYRKAMRIAFLKNKASSVLALGVGLHRYYFLELGKRFTSKDLLASPEDIFYLSLDELRQIVSGGCAGNTCNNYRLRVAIRKRDMSELGESDPPLLIYE